MGGKQHIPSYTQPSVPSDTQASIPQSTQRYKRICNVCKKITEEFSCCGRRTQRYRSERTLGDVSIVVHKQGEKP